MIFDGGNNNLHEINILMNRINVLRDEIADIKELRKRIITEHIVKVFNANKRSALTSVDHSPLNQEPGKRLQNIEYKLEDLKADIEKYRKNTKRFDLFFEDFTILTKHVLFR